MMWIDTEQSTPSTKGILTDRIAKMIEGDFPEGQFFVYNVRSCSCEERLDMLITGIEAYHPDLVIIDNISDLIPSINDGEASVKIIDQLMLLAATYNCNIVVVIHLNKSGEKRNLRGWLGTEILHKAFEVYYCEQIYGTDIYSVEQTLSRKYRVTDQIYYRISEEGLPCSTDKPDTQERDEQGRYKSKNPEAYKISGDKVGSFNQDYIIRHPDDAVHPWEWDLRRLFADAMNTRAMMSPDDLQRDVMKLSGIRVANYYKKVFEQAVEQRVIKTEMIRGGRIAVIPLPT